MADANGAITSSASYDSFGNSTNNLTTRYQYTGREKDEFTGLYFYRARWYDANSGRFISEDPIGFNGGDVNLFGYVGSNPLNRKAPSGNIALPFLGLTNFTSSSEEKECNEEKSCERDIAKMEETFQRTKDFMNNFQGRSWLFLWNGMKGTLYNNTPACYNQAVAVRDILRTNSYENQWDFELEFLDFHQGHYYAAHTWVIARSTNSKCPVRKFDPWVGVSYQTGGNILL